MSAVDGAVRRALEQELGSVEIRPNPGPQEMFLASEADIAIYGGQAGGGKSYGLLLDPLRFIDVPGFGAVIFRRNSTDLTQEGGLWDEANKLYPLFQGRPRESSGRLDFRFPWQTRISFSHLQHEHTVLSKQGGQIAMVGMDEMTHFTASQFWYILSRNRSTCGVRPYFRGTCNPDPDSFVADLIAWWIDQDEFLEEGRRNPRYGLPIPERSGVLRWMVKLDDEIRWFDTKDEAIECATRLGLKDPTRVKSLTFIPASVYDNPPLLEKDPDYIGNLQLLGRVQRARLLDGNWKVRSRGGLVFNRNDFKIMELEEWAKLQKEVAKTVRRWDFAGTEAKSSKKPGSMREKMENDPDWTVGLKGSILKNRDIVITDMRRDRLSSGKVRELVKATAKEDGRKVIICIPQDPGQAGKDQVEDYAKHVTFGYTMKSKPETGSKLTRAEGYAAYAEHGHIYILRAPWNEVFLSEHDAFPSDGVHDDCVDTGAGLYDELTSKPPSTTELMAKKLKATQ